MPVAAHEARHRRKAQAAEGGDRRWYPGAEHRPDTAGERECRQAEDHEDADAHPPHRNPERNERARAGNDSGAGNRGQGGLRIGREPPTEQERGHRADQGQSGEEGERGASSSNAVTRLMSADCGLRVSGGGTV